MALKATLTKDEHAALDAAVQKFYVEKNGKFLLDAEGVEDVAGLKGALEKERGGRSDLEKQLKELVTKFEGIDPEKAREAQKLLQELEDKKLLDAGEIDKLIAQKTERMIADHTNQLKAKDDLVAKLTGERDGLHGSLKKLRLDGQIRDLASKKGVRPEAVADVLARFTMLGIDGTLWDMDGDKIVAKKDGQIRYGKDAAAPMTFDEGFELLQKEAGHLFGESTGSGAQNTHRGHSGAGGPVLTPDQARDPNQYRAAKAAAEKSGGQVRVQ